MTQTKYVAPIFKSKAFNCPHCGVYAVQKWPYVAEFIDVLEGRRLNDMRLSNMDISWCSHCYRIAVWNHYDGEEENTYHGKLSYPMLLGPEPIEDMPEEIKTEYSEAQRIVGGSPRAAAALLRLCVQKLMPALGEKGKDIDDDIKSLVKKGLPVEVQQALDSLRVIGNESVHPATINLNDDLETALALFNLLNFIVERMITQPKKISTIFNQLPQSKLDAIKKRDTPKI